MEGAEVKGLGPGRPRIERPELDASLKGPWVWDGTLEGCGWAPGRPGRQLPPQPSAGGFQRRAASPPLRRVSSGHIYIYSISCMVFVLKV